MFLHATSFSVVRQQCDLSSLGYTKLVCFSINQVETNYWRLRTTFRTEGEIAWMAISSYYRQTSLRSMSTHQFCRHMDSLLCLCRGSLHLWSASSRANRVCCVKCCWYLCKVSECLRYELMSNFAVKLVVTETFAWSPPSEADEEGSVQLIDHCCHPLCRLQLLCHLQSLQQDPIKM